MENFLNQFLRLRPKDDHTLPVFDYDSPISMGKTNFHFFSFSRNLDAHINGGTIPYKSGDEFDLSFDVHFGGKAGKKDYSFSKTWESKTPVSSIGELVDVEALIKNLLALDYAVHGDKMFDDKKRIFRKKYQKNIDENLVTTLNNNIKYILEGSPKDNRCYIKPELVVGARTMEDILAQSMEYARHKSLESEMDSQPVYDL